LCKLCNWPPISSEQKNSGVWEPRKSYPIGRLSTETGNPKTGESLVQRGSPGFKGKRKSQEQTARPFTKTHSKRDAGSGDVNAPHGRNCRKPPKGGGGNGINEKKKRRNRGFLLGSMEGGEQPRVSTQDKKRERVEDSNKTQAQGRMGSRDRISLVSERKRDFCGSRQIGVAGDKSVKTEVKYPGRTNP